VPSRTLVLAALLAAWACTTEQDQAEAPPAAQTPPPEPVPASAVADSTDWTVGSLEAPATITAGEFPLPMLSALRTGVQSEHERFVIELETPGGLPGYHVEYVDRPLYDCGSGEPTYPVGDAWLQIRLEPANAHTEEGQPSAGPRQIAVDQPLIQRIYRTCDFEAVVVLVLAVSEPNPFRVMTLAEPPRIVVDVQR
jgi:hypothetical protein